MQLAGAAIAEFVAGQTFEGYLGNSMLRSAVERQFMIIGEAAARLRDEDRDQGESTLDRIENVYRIIGFRNILVHGYSEILPDVVWGTAKNHLPLLMRDVKALLAE